MNRIVRISAAQLPTVMSGKTFAEKQAKNLNEIVTMLELAGKRGSDLVLFGEYANLHHRTWSEDKKEYIADPIPGVFTHAIAERARKLKMNVALPMFGTYKGALSSYVVLFNRRGRIIGCYQKAHPTVPEQGIGIMPGNDLTVYKFDCASVGIMTCMDIEYPEVAQVFMLRGADLLLFPHVQGSWGEVDWEIRYRARAIDTGLPVVSACYGYPEGEWMPGKMIGRSSVIGRDGLVLADMGRGIGVLTYDLDLSAKRITPFYFNEKYDRTLAVTASRRPELYRDLVDETAKKKALKEIAGKKKGKG
jgi:predicted amidohydrolase